MKCLLLFFAALIFASVYSLPLSGKEDGNTAKELLLTASKVLRESEEAGVQHSLKTTAHQSTMPCQQATLENRQECLERKVSGNEATSSAAQPLDDLLKAGIQKYSVLYAYIPLFNAIMQHAVKLVPTAKAVSVLAERSSPLESPNIVYDHFLDECLAPYYESFTELLKMFRIFGGDSENLELDKVLKFVTNIRNSAKNHDFSLETSKTLFNNIVKAFLDLPQLFDADSSVTQAQSSETLSKLLKSTINILENIDIPVVQFLKHLLVLGRTNFADHITADDKAALDKASDFFLDYFLTIPDSATGWTDEFKAAFRDTLKQVVPLYFKRAMSNGEELSAEEKRSLLKSTVRLLVANAGDNSLLRFGDHNDQEQGKGLEVALDSILDTLLGMFSTEFQGAEKFELAGCLGSLRELLSYISRNLHGLLGEGRLAENTPGGRM